MPEHPRPDFEREWINLNGKWGFYFDSLDVGVEDEWFVRPIFTERLQYLSPGVPNFQALKTLLILAGTVAGWIFRWNGKRTFLVIGACDWLTTVWIDGELVGNTREDTRPLNSILQNLSPGKSHQLVMRVDDSPLSFKLEGKQGYGEAKGIWQTVYLESRGSISLSQLHFTPDIDKGL